MNEVMNPPSGRVPRLISPRYGWPCTRPKPNQAIRRFFWVMVAGWAMVGLPWSLGGLAMGQEGLPLAKNQEAPGNPTLPSEQNAAGLQPLTLDEALKQALANNPRLGALQSKARAASHAPQQAAAWPDPMLSVGWMNVPTDTWRMDVDRNTMTQLTWSQRIPLWGKSGLKEDSAQAEAQAAAQDASEARLLLIRQVKEAWWALYATGHMVANAEATLDLMRDLVNTTASKYKVGMGLQQDVLLAQVQQAKMIDMKLDMERMRNMAALRLNTLLHRPAQTPVVLAPATTDGQAQDAAADDPVRLPELKVPETLGSEAPQPPGADMALHRPALEAIRLRTQAARHRLTLARRDQWPDVSISLSYGMSEYVDPTTNMMMPATATLMLGMEIPFGSRRNEAAAQKQEDLANKEMALADRQDALQAELEEAKLTYAQARARAMLYHQTILPQARQAVAAMKSAYVVNKVDFMKLLDAQMLAFSIENDYWKAQMEARQALARLAHTLGKEDL